MKSMGKDFRVTCRRMIKQILLLLSWRWPGVILTTTHRSLATPNPMWSSERATSSS